MATNAVLEQRGARTALVTTEGFRDVLELRRLRIPRMYEPFWRKPDPLVPRRLRFEVRERMAADGEVLMPLDDADAREVAAALREAAVESVAVCLLHAYLYPEHEERLGAILREELPGVTVSLSSEILREQREYERTATTVVNAYVRPLMERYVGAIRTGLDAAGIEAPLTLMQSSGGVMTAEDATARPVLALESGPAAGVVAALEIARRLGHANAIAFDMGGTTAKASLIERGTVSRGREYEVGGSLSAGSRLMRGSGELLRIPTIDIAEVGAGGGSIAWLDTAGGLQVGPRSAGADPGPACYGRGGTQPTVTDANVFLGFVPEGPLADGEIDVDRSLAAGALEPLAAELDVTAVELATGIHAIANARMMRALRSVSSEKGRDPRDFALIAYGGAGPVHATGLAEDLGCRTVLVPALAGLFSAVGLLYARPEFHEVRAVQLDARAVEPRELDQIFDELGRKLSVDLDEVELVRTAELRYDGQTWEIEVGVGDPARHARARRGVRGRARAALRRARRARGADRHPRAPARGARAGARGRPPVARGRIRAGHGHARDRPRRPAGPLARLGRRGAGRGADADRRVRHDRRRPSRVDGAARARHRHARPGGAGVSVRTVDPITQEIVGNALASIADEMATTIFRTAHSTVVRDGMDFSAALCGPDGETVAQAVTVPFHLGSVPHALDTLRAKWGDRMQPGDVFVMNDPFDGGIHLQDIFVFRPVYLEGTLIGFATTTAHHGDVGGRLPGSAACDNTEIFQEGIRLPWLKLYDRGEPVETVFEVIRANVRIPRMTLGDLAAQVAATTVAERELQQLARRYGPERLASLMTGLVDHTERLVRQEIAAWPDGVATFTDYLDSDGIERRDVPITATVAIEGDEITVDLTESAPMVAGALNSTRSFIQACVYQAVRSAIQTEVPNTSGAFRPITVLTKPGTIAHVVMPGASSMRGVTGFRALDAVNGALAQLVPDRVPAAGEGGNTLAVFGAERPDGSRFVFYELVVGTWGGTPRDDGNDGLTNPASLAANIPVEVAESEFPIRIERYGLVPGSGGDGQHRGGLAVERVWRCLTPDTSLIVRSDRAAHPPYGLHGGAPGAVSSNLLIRADGSEEVLPSMFSTTIQAGDVFVHRTAGGGGWGDPALREPDRRAADRADGKVT